MAVSQMGKVQLDLGRLVMYAGKWLSLKAPYQWQRNWRGDHHSMSSKKKRGKGTWTGKKVV